MYGVEVYTAPTDLPVTAADLHAHLRLNGTVQTAILEKFIKRAVGRFEAATNRPILATVYRQYVNHWPLRLVLGRGGVTAVAAVKKYEADGTTETTVSASTWRAALKTPPAAIVFIGDVPSIETEDTVAGYVQYTAGWANAAAVPDEVIGAIELLAGHFYEHREAFTESELKELPIGWQSVCQHYKLGLTGDWGQ